MAAFIFYIFQIVVSETAKAIIPKIVKRICEKLAKRPPSQR